MPGVVQVKLLSYSAFSGPWRDYFPPFRGNFVHDIHLENSVNLRMLISYQFFGLAKMAVLPAELTACMQLSCCKFLEGGDG